MIQSKIKAKENEEIGVGAIKRRSLVEADHWAFLDEIEAPMWADLSLEPKLITEDNDDSWFHTSHLFHHHSARQLRSAFAHADVGNSLLNVNLQGAYSPQLPPSVSKSRGKDYRSRGWRSNYDQSSLSKGHPINDLGCKNSKLNTVSNREGKLKVNCGNQSKASSSITSVVDDAEGRIGLNSQSTSTNGVGLNSQSTSTTGVSTSTLTTVSWQQDSKVLEVSKEVGQAGGLLNSLKTNLRKSRATRPASRVAVSDDGETRGRKSSAGKSSVGSSSTVTDTKGKEAAVYPKADQCKQVKVQVNANTGSKHTTSSLRSISGSSNPKFEVKKVAAGSKQNKDRNLNVRDLKKSENSVNGRFIGKKMSEASVCARTNAYSSKIKGNNAGARNNTGATNGASSSKMKGNAVGVACSSKVASKSKVSLQITEKNSLNRSRTGSQGTKARVGSSQLNDLACTGKENTSVPVVRASDHSKNSKLKSKNKAGVTSVGTKVRTSMMDDGIMSLDTRLHLR